MQRTLALLAACCLLTSSGCGADSHDKIATEMISLAKQMNEKLSTIKDKQSAEAAKPELEALATEFKQVQEREKLLAQPSAEEQQALMQKYGQEMIQTRTQLMLTMGALEANPEVGPVLEPVFDKMR